MTIPLSRIIDLGNDKARMSDPKDAERQERTAEELLRRFFGVNFRPLQILADEVGMGKTYVALAVAFSLLEATRKSDEFEDLKGCYRKILVITPDNDALFRKWYRETEEFVRRCIPEKYRNNTDARNWFKATACTHMDELARSVRNPKGPAVLIIKTNRLKTTHAREKDTKLHFMFSALCSYWGKRLLKEERDCLLKGAPDNARWPVDSSKIGIYETFQEDALHFDQHTFKETLGRLESCRDEDVRKLMTDLLALAKELGTPYWRDRDVDFNERLKPKLADLYWRVCIEHIQQDFPLVIVDEAHNWKHGPEKGTNAFHEFERFIAPRARRLLLLTATPFQLAPSEMLEVLKAGDKLHVAPDRIKNLQDTREKVIRRVLKHSESASKQFAKAWAGLPKEADSKLLEGFWNSAELMASRKELLNLVEAQRDLIASEVDRISARSVQHLPLNCRGFFQWALRVYAFNKDYSQELGRLVIRHRRDIRHRLVCVGAEYGGDLQKVAARQDSAVLHAYPGCGVKGVAELPHYLLMRLASADPKTNHKKSPLGTALTGAYSTLLVSKEGESLRESSSTGESGVYFNVLRRIVDEKQDPVHPKVSLVVEQAVLAWERGEKYLIFCFRKQTATRLREIIRDRITAIIDKRRRELLGTEREFENFRGRFSGRDRDLMPAVTDRIMLSALLAHSNDKDALSYRLSDLAPLEEDFEGIARLALLYGVDVLKDQPDRIFLHRAVETVTARRILKTRTCNEATRNVLEPIAAGDNSWVERPQGVEFGRQAESDASLSILQRGIHARFDRIAETIAKADVKELAAALWSRERHAGKGRLGLIQGIALSPNLWFGDDIQTLAEGPIPPVIARLHQQLWRITFDDSDEPEEGLERRLAIFIALRRSVLRESALVRLIDSRQARDKEGWAGMLARRILEPFPGQIESLAHRLVAFVEDFEARSGSIKNRNSSRRAIIEATNLRDESLVALVQGGSGSEGESRDRIFTGFNTPLMPDVLVCTSVGQEGIDLHRQCRMIVHYDLPWNPATLEQRTGRIDRIGSKAFRERQSAKDHPDAVATFLEVGIPYLAATYDERIFEELRLRAQTFEVLTGGDFSADHVDGVNEQEEDEEGRSMGRTAVTLPSDLLEDLRISLDLRS